MTAEQVHRNHHESHIAFGTGGHNHHRWPLVRDGIRVQYNRCLKGAAPLYACPDEPDPLARLLAKLAERVVEAKEPPDRSHLPCTTHSVDRWRLYSARSGWVCLDCRGERRRYERVARRISERATRAA